MTRLSLILISILHITLFIVAAHGEVSPNTQTDKYVYLRSNKVNLRAGPNFHYPIKWTITQRGEPLKVLGKFYQWINIETINKNKGWVQEPMISTRYTYGIVMSKKDKPLIAYAMPSSSSKKIVKLEPGVRLRVLKCDKNKWCKIRAEEFKAWLPQENLWGINH